MVFVTGASGMLGSYLLYELARKNYKIRALKLESESIDNVIKIFKFYSDSPDELLNRIEWVAGNMLDDSLMKKVMKGVRQVYHLAAINLSNPADKNILIHDNVKGTENIVNAAIENSIEKFCHVSTVSALAIIENKQGRQDLFVTEKTPISTDSFYSYYAIGKYQCDRIVEGARKKGLDSIIVHPSWCIGAGDWSTGTSVLFGSAWKGFTYYTKGVRGFVDARDVCKAMVLLMESEIENDNFILSCENLTYKDIFYTMADCLGKKRPWILAPTWVLEIAWRIERARQLLTGSKPLLTQGKVKTFTMNMYYSNEKVRKKIHMEFVPVKDSIQHVAELFLMEHKS
jgi:dihydroflavonol-4-reductase